MKYTEILNWLFTRLSQYQRVGKSAYKADLEPILKLASYLNSPEKTFKTIHVGGTNGKGSTSHLLASILQEAGYRTGLYTSPHLKDFRERIKINGEMISEKYVSDFVIKHKPFFETNQLSFFEMTVGLAFDYFRNNKVDIAIIEVGLGGRLDSTNIISPEVSVITNIGLDHTEFLGNTLSKIADEKAGIIKSETPVVIGETQPETENIFKERAKEQHAPIVFADSKFQTNSKIEKYVSICDLKGNYQQKNIKTVLATVEIFQNKGWKISEENIENGLSKSAKNTGFMGRWQILGENPKIIADTAHNKEGLSLVINQLKTESFNKLHIVLGIVSDKDLNSILPLFPKDAKYYFCKPDLPRGMDADKLALKAEEYQLKGNVYSSVLKAFETAKSGASENDLIYVGGSTFVVGEVL